MGSWNHDGPRSPGRSDRRPREAGQVPKAGRGFDARMAGVKGLRRRMERRWVWGAAGVAALVAVVCPSAEAGQASLKGSQESIALQNQVAQRNDFSYLKTSAQVRRFLDQGLLVGVPGNDDYELSGVSFSCARPEVKLFIERLAAQYKRATGEKLVVTSLTRPMSRQPRNASAHSVHPCGMAVDIRRSSSASARRWLEQTLIKLEERGVVEATRERRPPHYHVAVFPEVYADYVTEREDPVTVTAYKVQEGDSLWGIARSHGVSVQEIRTQNQLRGNTIHPGQVLQIAR